MREAQVLKEQVDNARQKEVGLKAHIQPWLEEVFKVTTMIEGKLAQIQDTYVLRQEGAFDNDASEGCAKLIQWTTGECVADISEAQNLLDGLRAKITAPAE